MQACKGVWLNPTFASTSVGQIWAKAGRFRPKSPKCGQSVAQLGPTPVKVCRIKPVHPGLARVWPKLAQHRPIEPKCDQSRARFGPNRAEFGRNPSKLAGSRPDDPNPTDIDQSCPNPGHARPSPPKFGRSRPYIGRNRAKFDPIRCTRIWSKLFHI